MHEPAANPPDHLRAAVAKVLWRVLPLFVVMFIVNYVDRVNVGFAALRMNQDLGFSATVYGFGATIFFAGYVLLQIPSNLMVHRLGARAWLCVILLAWGSISTAARNAAAASACRRSLLAS